MAAVPAKRSLPYHHHHTVRHPQQPLPTREPALLEQETLDRLLTECITRICKEVARNEGIDEAAIGDVALVAFVAAIDEFMLRFLSRVRCSMVAARRTAPIAPDFEAAIVACGIPRLDDQLPTYKTDPPINRPLYPTPPPDDEFHTTTPLPQQAAFFGSALQPPQALSKFSLAAPFLPPLPSAHTFRHTPVYPARETDTRTIRELATHEGKLGEAALRKLAGAVKLDAQHPLESGATRELPKTRFRRQRKGVSRSEEAVFEETVRQLLAREEGGFELGPIVTCEKGLRMPDEGVGKRRAHASAGAGGAAADGDPMEL